MRDQPLLSYRKINFLGLLISGGALAYIALQLNGLFPTQDCALCAQLRVLLTTSLMLFAMGWLQNPRRGGQQLYAILNLVIISLSLSLLIKQQWQQMTGQVLEISCTSGLEFWLKQLPLTPDLLSRLSESGQCISQSSMLFGLSLPEQAIALFFLLLVLSWKQLRRKQRRRPLFL